MDDWAERRAEIETQITEGYAAAQRGDLIEAEQVRSKLNELKRTRLGES
jgi:hypothetical protein